MLKGQLAHVRVVENLALQLSLMANLEQVVVLTGSAFLLLVH